MNFLAHLLLAGEDPALRCGGFLGDFVRGPLRGDYPADIECGIALHRHIDQLSAALPAAREALAAFDPPWRRWAPIALDVLFDHYLARDFERYHPQPLPRFAAQCHTQLQAREHLYPAVAGQFLQRMRDHDLLQRYGTRAGLAGTLEHLSRRARPGNSLADMLGQLDRHDAHLQHCFERLLPAMQTRCAAWRAQNWSQALAGRPMLD